MSALCVKGNDKLPEPEFILLKNNINRAKVVSLVAYGGNFGITFLQLEPLTQAIMFSNADY